MKKKEGEIDKSSKRDGIIADPINEQSNGNGSILWEVKIQIEEKKSKQNLSELEMIQLINKVCKRINLEYDGVQVKASISTSERRGESQCLNFRLPR